MRPFQGASVVFTVVVRHGFQGVDVAATSLQQREGPSPPDGKLDFGAFGESDVSARASCPTRAAVSSRGITAGVSAARRCRVLSRGPASYRRRRISIRHVLNIRG